MISVCLLCPVKTGAGNNALPTENLQSSRLCRLKGGTPRYDHVRILRPVIFPDVVGSVADSIHTAGALR